MKDSERNHLNMGRRLQEFRTAHTGSFPAGTRGAELFDEVDTIVDNLEKHADEQDAAALARKQATEQKESACDALRALLKQVNETARGMEKLFPGISSHFQMPRGGDQGVISRANTFVKEAVPFQAEFVKRDLPATFFAEIGDAVKEVEDAIDRQNAAMTVRSARPPQLQTMSNNCAPPKTN